MDSPIFGGLQVDRSLNAADNQLFNLYPEIVETKQGKRIGALYATPGTKPQLVVGNGPIRAMHVAPALSLLFVASGDSLYSVSTTLVPTLLGTLAGSGDVYMIDNGTQVAVFSGHVGQVWTSAGGLVNIALPFAANVDSITATYVDGYGIINQPGTNIVFQSNLLDLATWNALNFGSATGDADNVIAVAQIHRELWFLKETECECWYNAGTAGFAFARLDGVYPQAGILAPRSLRRITESLIWLGKNKEGQAVVVRSSGHQVQRVSTHSIEQMIQGATLAQLQAATAYTYQQQGHEFYVLNIADLSLCYDATESALAGMPLWHQRATFNRVAATGPSSPNAPGPFVGPNVTPPPAIFPPPPPAVNSFNTYRWDVPAVSLDGSVIWGTHGGIYTSPAVLQAAAWWDKTTGLPTLMNDYGATGGGSYGNACSADGKIGVGYAQDTGNPHIYHAAWWDKNSHAMTVLPDAGTANADSNITAMALSCTPDGSIIGGAVGQGGGASLQACWWLRAGGPFHLVTAPGGGVTVSAINAMSADGAFLIGGQIFTPWVAVGTPGQAAYWWTRSDGTLHTLDRYQGGEAAAVACSADGRWIVGWVVSGSNDLPCVWDRTAAAGAQLTLLNMPPGATTGKAHGISADGRIIVGTANGTNYTNVRWNRPANSPAAISFEDGTGLVQKSESWGCNGTGTLAVGRTFNSSNLSINYVAWWPLV